MTSKEQSRIQVLNGVLEGKVTVVQAAQYLLSDRDRVRRSHLENPSSELPDSG